MTGLLPSKSHNKSGMFCTNGLAFVCSVVIQSSLVIKQNTSSKYHR